MMEDDDEDVIMYDTYDSRYPGAERDDLCSEVSMSSFEYDYDDSLVYEGAADTASIHNGYAHAQTPPLDRQTGQAPVLPFLGQSFRESGPIEPALMAPTMNGSNSNLNPAQPATPLSDLARQLSEAQAYWSNRPDHGLGFGKGPQDLGDKLKDIDADLEIRGAPMRNEYYRPGVVLDDITLGPDLDGVSIDVDDEDVQPTSRPSATRGTRGQRGERGGRGERGQRGRGGYKWALVGTEWDAAKRRKEARAQRGRGQSRGRADGETRRSGAPRGPRKPADPGPEYKKHMTEATQAWMDNDLDRAFEAARLAVQANPEVWTAHNLLSEILLKLGRKEDAVGALMSGANTKKDAEVWIRAAERTLELAGDDRTDHHRGQALFAYSHAVQRSANDPDMQYIARTGKRDMAIELEDYHEARLQGKAMIRLRPHEMDSIRLYAELCADSKDITELFGLREAYETAFAAVEAGEESLGDPAEAWSQINIYLEVLDRIFAGDITSGFFEQGKKIRNAILMLRRLARLILGRRDERFWDDFVDDREFDSSNERRNLVGEFQQGKVSRDKALYGDGLPLELRVKLGLFRIKLGMLHHQEGLQHLDHLLAHAKEVDQYYDVFLHVAETLRTYRLWKPALKFYEAIRDEMDITDDGFFMGIAQCFAETERYGDAEDIYRWIIRKSPQEVQARIDLAKLYEKQGWKEEALPLIKEVMRLGRKEDVIRANLLPRQHQRPRKQSAPMVTPGRRNLDAHNTPDGVVPQSGRSAQYPTPTPSARSSEQPALPQTTQQHYASRMEDRLRRMQLQEKDIEKHHSVVQTEWPALEDDTNEQAVKKWMDSARLMVEAFRQMDVFYPVKRPDKTRSHDFVGYARTHKSWRDESSSVQKQANEVFDRLRSTNSEDEDDEDSGAVQQPKSLDPSVPRDFHGIVFTEWHRIFVDLALLYAKYAEQLRCYDVLKGGLFRANVFACDPEMHNTSLAAAMCCAFTFNDSEFVTSISRKYIKHGDSRTSMPYRLLAAGNRLCFGDTYLTAGPTQKLMSRLVKSMDYPLLPENIRSKVDYGNSAQNLNNRLERLGEGNSELDAGVLMAFGHTLASTNGGMMVALSCYLRALALQPNSFSINFTLGVCYIQAAMKRTSENRQYGIQQGLSFVQRYYELRTASGRAGHLQEAEYNMAKTWHMLGLTHLAVPGFEKVLALSEKVHAEKDPQSRYEAEDFAKEAAFALQQMFALAGNYEAARAITQRWLVV